MKKTKSMENDKAEAYILGKLFPEGVKSVKIWNGFIHFISRSGRDHLSIEKLELVADRKFKIKRRIRRFFPKAKDQLRIVSRCDIRFLHLITQETWGFTGSYARHAKDALVLHGATPREVLLDWAAQAVVAMLLKHIGASP